MLTRRNSERGFIMVTSLVILLILTVMLIGLYFRGKTNQESSVSARDSTKAYYLAEAGLNYMNWALYMNPSDATKNNNKDLDGANGADNAQIESNPNQVALPASSQLGYFDVNNTIGYDPNNLTATKFATVVSKMLNTPIKHVELDITLGANNTPSVTANWGGGTLVPSGNGAVVWLVPATPLDTTGKSPLTEKDSHNTSGNYAIYAYSIGYVNGKPIRMLRAKIGSVSTGFPSDLGAITNGFNP